MVACPPLPPSSIPSAAALAAALAGVLRERPPRPSHPPGRRAAVLIVIYDREGEAHILLTKRRDDLPSHPGQIALPGGTVDPEDRSARDAALRETEEEVGLPRAGLRVIGELDDVDTIVTGFIIRPFVALLEGPMTAVASDDEVARLVHAPVAELLRADAAMPGEPGVLALRYPLDGEDVWGATARILRTFSRIARCALSPEGASPAAAGAGPAPRP